MGIRGNNYCLLPGFGALPPSSCRNQGVPGPGKVQLNQGCVHYCVVKLPYRADLCVGSLGMPPQTTPNRCCIRH